MQVMSNVSTQPGKDIYSSPNGTRILETKVRISERLCYNVVKLRICEPSRHGALEHQPSNHRATERATIWNKRLSHASYHQGKQALMHSRRFSDRQRTHDMSPMRLEGFALPISPRIGSKPNAVKKKFLEFLGRFLDFWVTHCWP